MDPNDGNPSFDTRKFLTTTGVSIVLTSVATFFAIRWILGDNEAGEPNAADGGSMFLIVGMAIAAILVVGFGALFVMGRTLGSTITGITLTVQPGFTMPHRIGATDSLARRFGNPVDMVDGLEALGFGRTGAYRADLPDHSAIFACMLSADGRTLATVTPVHATLVSVFDGKVLSTTNENSGAPRSPWNLAQTSPSKDMASLFAAHAAGLHEVAKHGAHPQTQPADTAVELAVVIDRASIRDFDASRPLRAMAKAAATGQSRMLGDGPSAAKRITEWMNSPERWG